MAISTHIVVGSHFLTAPVPFKIHSTSGAIMNSWEPSLLFPRPLRRPPLDPWVLNMGSSSSNVYSMLLTLLQLSPPEDSRSRSVCRTAPPPPEEDASLTSSSQDSSCPPTLRDCRLRSWQLAGIFTPYSTNSSTFGDGRTCLEIRAETAEVGLGRRTGFAGDVGAWIFLGELSVWSFWWASETLIGTGILEGGPKIRGSISSSES